MTHGKALTPSVPVFGHKDVKCLDTVYYSYKLHIMLCDDLQSPAKYSGNNSSNSHSL